jgi:ribosomal protein S18 acetylase RimI-like enzyme
MNTITVRQAVLSDLDVLAPLFDEYRQFQGCASDLAAARAFLLARFNHNESVLFIAHQDDDPVGFTQLYPMFSSVSLARVYVLNDLLVRERARGQGVATQLMASALQYARSLGAVRVSLVAALTNTVAQSVYDATGWKRDAQFQAFHYALAVTAAQSPRP